MGYFLPETASAESDLNAKNRVRGFSGGSVLVILTTCRAAPQPRRENYGDRTKTASGIPYWPSRDPIGEAGGLNLYEFVGNDGVNKFDLFGLAITFPMGGGNPSITSEIGSAPSISPVIPGPGPTIPLSGQPGYLPPVDEKLFEYSNCVQLAFRDADGGYSGEYALRRLECECTKIDCADNCIQGWTKFTYSDLILDFVARDKDTKKIAKRTQERSYHLAAGNGMCQQKFGASGPIAQRPSNLSAGDTFPYNAINRKFPSWVFELVVVEVKNRLCFCCRDNP